MGAIFEWDLCTYDQWNGLYHVAVLPGSTVMILGNNCCQLSFAACSVKKWYSIYTFHVTFLTIYAIIMHKFVTQCKDIGLMHNVLGKYLLESQSIPKNFKNILPQNSCFMVFCLMLTLLAFGTYV